MGDRNELKVYPVPEGAVLQKDYIMRVRLVGTEEWKAVPIFQVKVDMHDVREASMAYFDFCGKVEVEVTFTKFYCVHKVDIRPLSKGIQATYEPRKVTFMLEEAANLSIEMNNERFHNIHLFAGELEEVPDKTAENVYVVKGSLTGPSFFMNRLNSEIEKLPKGRIVYFEAGVHYMEEFLWKIPADTKVYFEGGAIFRGGLLCEDVENIEISGRGMIYQAHFERFSGTYGIRVSHSKNISISDIMFVNPPHYTAYLGDSEKIFIKNIKSFSCEGWSDGIDMMSCRDVTVDGGFLRTSDDCIAIYGSRWDNFGDCRNVKVSNITLWADVAHPMMIGTHGNHQEDGDVIEDIYFENIDVLEHHEHQPGYLGVMAINAGDKNTVRNVSYHNIRIEAFEHGKVLDVQTKFNPDYNPAPGRKIENIKFDGVYVLSGNGEEPSVIAGYSEESPVENVTIENFYRDGIKMNSLEEAGIKIGNNAINIEMK